MSSNSKYLVGYLNEVIRSLVLILPKISGYVKTFKDNYKLMFFHIDDDNLSEKYETIWTKFEDLKNCELSALPVYGNRYIKTKIRTYGNKVYTNFHGLNVLELESFTIISIYYLFVYENKHPQDILTIVFVIL